MTEHAPTPEFEEELRRVVKKGLEHVENDKGKD